MFRCKYPASHWMLRQDIETYIQKVFWASRVRHPNMIFYFVSESFKDLHEITKVLEWDAISKMMTASSIAPYLLI